MDADPLTDATVERLSGGAGQGLGVYRVNGRAWSAILKVLPASGDEPPHEWCYVEREPLAYRSGLLDSLPGGLAAPRCVGLDRDGDGSHRVWLEDLGSEQRTWTLADYGRAARCLGEFNGAYLAGHPVPPYDWLSRDFLRRWLARTNADMALLEQHRDHPLVRRVYTPEVTARMAALWDDRERLLDALDRLPQTLCHHDAFRRNLVAHGDRIVALDWAFVGRGPVGAEISPLVSATLTFREVGSEQRPELERVVLASYMDGLRAAGWDGPEDHVRYGYAATSALRYGPGTVRIVLPALLDPALHDGMAELFGIPFEEVLDNWASVIRDDVALYDSLASG